MYMAICIYYTYKIRCFYSGMENEVQRDQCKGGTCEKVYCNNSAIRQNQNRGYKSGRKDTE